MKIWNVALERMGQLSPLRLQNLSAGLNLIYGPEGSGKSDLMYAIPWVLFGPAMRQPLGPSEVHVDHGSAATLDVIDENGQTNRLRREGATFLESSTDACDDSDFRRMFVLDRAIPTALWPTILQSAAGYCSSMSRNQVHRNYQDEIDRNERIRDCRHRLTVLGPVCQSRSSLQSERQQLEAKLTSLRDLRTRELAQRDRELRTARIEREQIERRIDRVVSLIDRLDGKIRRRAQLEDSARRETGVWSTWQVFSHADHDVTHRSEYRWAGTALHRHLVRWEALHQQLREEIAALRQLQASFESSDLVPHVTSNQLAYLICSLDLELDELESQSREIEGVPFADESKATVRNLRSLVDSLLARTPSADWKHLQEAVRRSPGALEKATVAKGLDVLEASENRLHVLIEELRLRHDGNEFKGFSARSSSGDRGSSFQGGERVLEDTVRNLHAVAMERLNRRRSHLADMREKLQRSLHVSETRFESAWNVDQIDEEVANIRLRLERIERDLAVLAEQDRLTRELQGLEHESRSSGHRRDDLWVGRDASVLLQRMTGGELRTVTFDEWFNVSVEDHSGMRRTHAELRNELQNAVATCLQLALVAAYRSAGRVMPLLIDLKHSEWALQKASELVPILSELAATGQQILVFTAIREIVPLFEHFPVSVYTLVRRTVTERVSVDRMRPEPPNPWHSTVRSDVIDSSGNHSDVRSRVNLVSANGVSSTDDRSSIWRSTTSTAHADHVDASMLWPWPRRNDENRSTIPFVDVPLTSDAAKSVVRHYLNRRDDVVDAPSIGPKTAERLYQVGVRTVYDLLQGDPATLAKRLEHRGITSAVVRDWQDQSRLMCQVPYLRGHDAGLLVACGVRDPHQLSVRDAQTLFLEVEQLTNTQEGRRIVRNGKKPDLAEVQDWIRWAQQARTMDAA